MDNPQKLSETLKRQVKENSQENHILHDSSDLTRCLEKANLWRQRVEECFRGLREETAVPTCGHEVSFLDDGNVPKLDGCRTL